MNPIMKILSVIGTCSLNCLSDQHSLKAVGMQFTLKLQYQYMQQTKTSVYKSSSSDSD